MGGGSGGGARVRVFETSSDTKKRENLVWLTQTESQRLYLYTKPMIQKRNQENRRPRIKH